MREQASAVGGTPPHVGEIPTPRLRQTYTGGRVNEGFRLHFVLSGIQPDCLDNDVEISTQAKQVCRPGFGGRFTGAMLVNSRNHNFVVVVDY